MDRDSTIRSDEWRAWWIFAIITSACAAYYALLNNGLWMPRNDATYYLSIARSIAQGQGLVFNGDPVTLVPPGWPAVLAGLMQISPSFQFLNFVTISLMALTCGVWFWILRRFARLPVVIVILAFSAILFDWFTAAIQLRSEALFCLILASVLVISFQITEKKPLHWRLALLLPLCSAMVTVRWAGLVNWLLIAAVLLKGELWPRLNRRWVATVLTGLVTLVTFFGLRHYQAEVFPRQLAARYELETMLVSERESPAPISEITINPKKREILSPTPPKPKAEPMEGLLTRASGKPALVYSGALEMGLWWASLFWKPTYLAVAVPVVAMLANLLGWVLIAIYTWTAVAEARERRWLLLAALLLSLTLVIRWPNLRPMYLMPIAPLLMYGIWRGVDEMARRFRGGLAGTMLRGTFWAAAATMVLVNVSLFAVETWVAHSPDYYGRYFAGRAKDFLGVVKYLKDAEVKNAEIGINPEYQNLNRVLPNGFARRNLNLLLDRTIRDVPPKIGNRVPDHQIFSVARSMGLRYYVWRPPVSPWQLWHFHAPAIQKHVTNVSEVQENPTWILYEITDEGGERIELPDLSEDELPRKVSGLGEDWRPE